MCSKYHLLMNTQQKDSSYSVRQLQKIQMRQNKVIRKKLPYFSKLDGQLKATLLEL